MAIRRVKLVWSGARDNFPGLWRFGLWNVYDRDPGSRIQHLAISVRGLIVWCAGLAVAAYLFGATALFVWFQRSPYNLVHYSDTLLLPVRWSHVRELRGRAMIEEGLADFRAQRWSDGNLKLAVGLMRAPHDWRARLQLAQFNLAVNRREYALKLLTDDLSWGYPGRPYLTTLFAMASEGEDYDIVIAACDRFLPSTPVDRNWLLTEKIKALIGDGQAAEALALLDAEQSLVNWQLREERVMALLTLDRAPEAIQYLERWDRAQPQDHVQVLRLKVRALREAHRLADMDAALEEFRQIAPDDPRAYVYGVVQRALAGEAAAANAALDDFFMRFSADPQNLGLATGALVDAHAAALVDRCVREAALHGFPPKPFLVWQLQVQIGAGDWIGAQRSVGTLKPLMKNAPPNEQFAFEWMQRLVIACARPDEEPAAALMEFLQRRPLPMRVYRLTGETLIAASRWTLAQNVIGAAARIYPSSRALLHQQQQVDAALKARTPAKAEFVAAPKSAPLGVEKLFFQKLADEENAGHWAEAARALNEVRVAKPAWLAKRESEVLEAQMRIAMHTGDMLEMTGAAKIYLDGTSARAGHVYALARELGARGARDDGEALLNEILRKLPHYPPAERLLKEWHPADAKKKKP